LRGQKRKVYFDVSYGVKMTDSLKAPRKQKKKGLLFPGRGRGESLAVFCQKVHLALGREKKNTGFIVSERHHRLPCQTARSRAAQKRKKKKPS